MADNFFTGSEDYRFGQIHNNWIVFEPVTNSEFAIDNTLYSLPLGQQIDTDIIIDSGSIEQISGTIQIEKTSYFFDNEQDANNFVAETGQENILSYREIETNISIEDEKRKYVEIQVVNYPFIDLNFELKNAINNNGFTMEVWASGLIEEGGLRKLTDEITFERNRRRVVSDTYITYFNIKEDS